MEENAVYDLGRDDDPLWPSVDNNGNENVVAQQLIATMYCPSRRAPQGYGGARYVRVDYAANGGFHHGRSGSRINYIPEAPLGAPALGARTAANGGLTGGRSGPISGPIIWAGDQRKRTLADMLDGTRSTIVFAEKAMNWMDHGVDGGDNERWNNAGWDEAVIRWHFPPKSDRQTIGTVPGTSTRNWPRYFGSTHTAGLNAAFVDGSVRFFSYSIDATTWLRLCVSDDGEVIDRSAF